VTPPGAGEEQGNGAADPVAAREAYWEGFVRRMARVERIREEHRVLMLGAPGAREAVFWAEEFGCRVRVIDADAGVGAALEREAVARNCIDRVEFRQADPLGLKDLGLEAEGFSVIYAHDLAGARGFGEASAELRPFLEADGLGILRHRTKGRVKETIALFPKQGYEPITCELLPGAEPPAPAAGKKPRAAMVEGWFVGRRVEASGPPRWPRRRSSE
jgi:hypothetical protein